MKHNIYYLLHLVNIYVSACPELFSVCENYVLGKIGKNSFLDRLPPKLHKRGLLLTQLTSCKSKSAAEESRIIGALGIIQKLHGIPSNLSGTFCGD